MNTIKILSSIIMLMVLMIACDLTEPFSAPSWDTQWKIFFRTEEHTIKDMLKDVSLKDSSNTMIGNGDTLTYISILDTTEREEIDSEEMTFEPDPDQIIEEVGDIELDDPDPQTSRRISMEEFLGIPLAEGNTIPIIPPQTRSINPDSAYVTFTEFTRVVLKSGEMFITFHNNLTIDINSGMVISLYDSASSTLVNTFTFNDPIPRGQSLASDTLHFSNDEIFNSYYMDYIEVPIDGIDSVHTVTAADVDAYFNSSLDVVNMVATEANAEIPEQEIDEKDASELEIEDKKLIRAVVDSGNIHVVIENTLDIDAFVQINILSLVDESDNDSSMTIDTLLMRSSTTIIDKNIKGKTILNHKSPRVGIVDSIHYTVDGNTVATTDHREVLSTQTLIVDVNMGKVKTSEFNGLISELKIPIDPVEKSDIIDLKDFDGSFRLPDLELAFDFKNQIGFDIDVDLIITGIKEGAAPLTITKQGTINRADQNGTVTTTLTLSGNDPSPNIVDLMESLPTTISVEGEGIIQGPGDGQEGKVSLGNALWAEYRIESLMKMEITEPLIYNEKIKKIDLDEDTRIELSENTRDVLLKLNPENGLPLNVDLIFVMALDTINMFDEQIADSSEKIVLHKLIEAGDIGVDGLVTSSTISTDFELPLNKKQLQIFSKIDSTITDSTAYFPVYNAVQVRIDAAGPTIIFRKNDALKYDGYLDLKYKVDLDDE